MTYSPLWNSLNNLVNIVWLTKQGIAKFTGNVNIIFIFKSIDMCAQVLIEYWFYLSLKSSVQSVCFIYQIAAFCGVNGFLCVCSSRKSASRLICRIASSSITTRAPPSVITVAVCYGVSTNRALNVKVNPMFYLYCVISAQPLPSVLPLIFYSFIVFPSSASLIHLS